MEIFFGWIIFSIIVGALGNGRKIGFGGAFFLSLLLSPVIGLIITLFSKDKEDEKFKQDVLSSLNQKQGSHFSIQDYENTTSLSDELDRLKRMKERGFINEDEFRKAKEKLFSSSFDIFKKR